jgi:hypothetical protein
MPLAKQADDPPEQVDPGRGTGADDERASSEPPELADGFPGALERGEEPVRVVQQEPTGLRELDRTPESIQQPCPQLLFELTHVLGQRGLTGVESFGCAAKALGLGHRHEHLDLPEVIP